MRIAVLGGGNGSLAAAGDFALQGHEVRLWRRGAEGVAALPGGRVRVRDFSGLHEARLALVTPEMGPAVAGAELVLCPVPATAQASVAERLAPHLTEDQVVFLTPGTFGSLVLAEAARAAGTRAVFAETGTLPWLARKRGPAEVAISVRARRLPVGVFPLARAGHALAVIGQAFPDAIEPCGDALSGALMNAGPIIHPPLIVMNAGAIEHFASRPEGWDIHREGTQPAIRRVTDALDAERIAVRAALGYGPPHFPLAHHYASEGEVWMYGRGAHERLTDSGDWREPLDLTAHRYVREDLRLGLSFLVSAAALAGVEVPLARAFLAIGGAINGEDGAGGRTLAGLGLGALDRAALQVLLRDGFPEGAP